MPSGIRKLDFASSDDIRKPDKTVVETVTVGATSVARLTVQPGWVWSECVAPHLGVVQSGQLKVMHEDGSEEMLNPGDVYECRPGHQAEAVGDVPCVMIEFNSEAAAKYAT